MAEQVLSIANYFIEKGNSESIPITPMKLLKLVYISHGWHLGLTGLPLIEESVEAWQYGPVIPSVYRHFKDYRNQPIPLDARATYVQFSEPSRIKPFLDSVWNSYKIFNGVELSSMTHAPETPWDIVWNKQGGKNYLGANIPDDLIRRHYQLKAQKVPNV